MGRRTRRPADVAAALDALYAELPRIECRGSCHDSCGPVGMLRAERRRVAAAGFDVTPTTALTNNRVCVALTVLKRCAVYPIRPMICRLWGLTRAMTCTYGCVPDGGHLTEVQAYEFLALAADIAGEPAEAERFRRVAALPDLERRVRAIRGPLEEIAALEHGWNRPPAVSSPYSAGWAVTSTPV